MKQQNFTIRPFEYNDDDYIAAVELVNKAWPDDPSTVEEWKDEDKNGDLDALNLRFIGEITQANATQVVAVASISGSAKRPGKYTLDFDIDPAFEGQGLDEILFNHLVKALDDKNPLKLKIWIKEDKTQRIELVEQKGFQKSLCYRASELDLSSFEFAPFTRYLEKVAASGITILNLQELEVRDSDWMQKLYDLEMTISKDIRYAEEHITIAFEEYAKEFKGINFRADAVFVALDGDEYVGSCWLEPQKVIEGSKIDQSFTGVLSSHRRRGIATALKLKTIMFAQAHGAKALEANNEENNPMYDLNIKLGFKPAPAWLHFQKVL